MKVNISYAVELQDVPAEVGRLIDRCGQQFRVLHDDFDMIGCSNPLEALKKISEIRESMARLDHRLSDCANILGGYLEVSSKVELGEDLVTSRDEEGNE